MTRLLHSHRGGSLAHVAGQAALHSRGGGSGGLLRSCCRPLLLQAAHMRLHVPKTLAAIALTLVPLYPEWFRARACLKCPQRDILMRPTPEALQNKGETCSGLCKQ